VSEDVVYVVTSMGHAGEAPPGDAMRVDADERGRVIFRDPVPVDKAQAGFQRCIRFAENLLQTAAKELGSYEVDEITLKLSLDSEVGCYFVADAKLGTAIEVKIRRSPSKSPARG